MIGGKKTKRFADLWALQSTSFDSFKRKSRGKLGLLRLQRSC